MIVKAGRYYLLAIAIMIPYGLIFISCVLKWIFGSFLFPHKSTIILVCFDVFIFLYEPHCQKTNFQTCAFSDYLNQPVGVVGWCEGAVYLRSPGRPTDIGLQLGKACYPCSG